MQWFFLNVTNSSSLISGVTQTLPVLKAVSFHGSKLVWEAGRLSQFSTQGNWTLCRPSQCLPLPKEQLKQVTTSRSDFSCFLWQGSICTFDSSHQYLFQHNFCYIYSMLMPSSSSVGWTGIALLRDSWYLSIFLEGSGLWGSFWIFNYAQSVSCNWLTRYQQDHYMLPCNTLKQLVIF